MLLVFRMSLFVLITRYIINLIDSINEGIGRMVSWLTLFMVLLTFIIVILRYTLDIGWISLQESVLYMHAVVFMLGASYTLKHDAHVRVDIFYQHCGARTRAWINFFGTLLLLFPVSMFIIWSSWDYVVSSWEIHESSRNSGGLPGVYWLKTCIPIMGGLLALQGLAMLLRNLMLGLGIDITGQCDDG